MRLLEVLVALPTAVAIVVTIVLSGARRRVVTWLSAVLLDPEAEDERREKILADVEGLIDRHGGTLLGRHDWGVRQAAFEIRKKPDGFYAVIDLNAEPAVVAELDRQLNLNESVLRTKVMRPDLR